MSIPAACAAAAMRPLPAQGRERPPSAIDKAVGQILKCHVATHGDAFASLHREDKFSDTHVYAHRSGLLHCTVRIPTYG
jgi:hypothetical protein